MFVRGFNVDMNSNVAQYLVPYYHVDQHKINVGTRNSSIYAC